MNMKQETQDNLKQIKRRFRLMMNGMASQSMREKDWDTALTGESHFPY